MIETLEEEFSRHKIAHMVNVLCVKIEDYYRTLEEGQINFMDFLRNDSPRKLALRDIRELYHNNRKEFFALYERAYQELVAKGELI